jgi:hypothetical protein
MQWSNMPGKSKGWNPGLGTWVPAKKCPLCVTVHRASRHPMTSKQLSYFGDKGETHPSLSKEQFEPGKVCVMAPKCAKARNIVK